MPKQWVTTNELLEKFDLTDFELLDLIKKVSIPIHD
jgi:hypothetical protein